MGDLSGKAFHINVANPPSNDHRMQISTIIELLLFIRRVKDTPGDGRKQAMHLLRLMYFYLNNISIHYGIVTNITKSKKFVELAVKKSFEATKDVMYNPLFTSEDREYFRTEVVPHMTTYIESVDKNLYMDVLRYVY